MAPEPLQAGTPSVCNAHTCSARSPQKFGSAKQESRFSRCEPAGRVGQSSAGVNPHESSEASRAGLVCRADSLTWMFLLPSSISFLSLVHGWSQCESLAFYVSCPSRDDSGCPEPGYDSQCPLRAGAHGLVALSASSVLAREPTIVRHPLAQSLRRSVPLSWQCCVRGVRRQGRSCPGGMRVCGHSQDSAAL